MPLNATALGEALDEDLTLHTTLCRRDAPAFQRASRNPDDLVVACTQESRLFNELAGQTEGAVALDVRPIRFVNIRETGGWGREAAHATPTMAALLAAARLPEPEPVAAAPEPAPVPEPIPEPIPVVAKEIWRIGPDDGTVRQALARWAAKANWTFGPDQWELNFDLPIQAPAEFEAESFQEATQALSQAIAMTESPVRPCFYANRVLRMVPFTRSCNRSPATQS